ncbi:hypothetical protein ACFRAR_28250 [Kitasatospora sp. NPDC056651]|uniref:hypothetical protein n=1 Tax=Kitasatospora sp. NPDC056651 TaxID=3345892 RepID=UPI0036B03436
MSATALHEPPRRPRRDDRRATPEEMAVLMAQYRAAKEEGRSAAYPLDPECVCPRCTEQRAARNAVA